MGANCGASEPALVDVEVLEKFVVIIQS